MRYVHSLPLVRSSTQYTANDTSSTLVRASAQVQDFVTIASLVPPYLSDRKLYQQACPRKRSFWTISTTLPLGLRQTPHFDSLTRDSAKIYFRVRRRSVQNQGDIYLLAQITEPAAWLLYSTLDLKFELCSSSCTVIRHHPTREGEAAANFQPSFPGLFI